LQKIPADRHGLRGFCFGGGPDRLQCPPVVPSERDFIPLIRWYLLHVKNGKHPQFFHYCAYRPRKIHAADRFIQMCGGLSEREMSAQVLDSMDLERERGITIKAQSVTLNYTAKNGEIYHWILLTPPVTSIFLTKCHDHWRPAKVHYW